MTDREFWMTIRRALLMIAEAIAKKLEQLAKEEQAS